MSPTQRLAKVGRFETGSIEKQRPVCCWHGFFFRTCSGGIRLRVAPLAESLRHFSGLAVGETAAILSLSEGGMRRGQVSPVAKPLK